MNRLLLKEILEGLEAKNGSLYMYFQDMTQTEIAGRLGVSQVQVSHGKKILGKLREKM